MFRRRAHPTERLSVRIYANFPASRFISYLLLLSIVVSNFAVLPVSVSVAQAAINKQINYQGKLTNASNVAVANGSYNVRFKLYTQVSGGAAVWTETLCYSPDSGTTCNGTGADGRVTISNGLFSVLLGSTTSLSSVDFNQTLYLGVEIGGTSAASPSWDGEMSPRKKLGAVPAAFESDRVDGISSEQFIRADAANSTSTASTFLSVTQTGAGNIAEFFGTGSASRLTVSSSGNVGVGTSSPFARLSVAGDVVAGRFVATTTTASVFPFASTTALTVAGTNGLTLGTLNGPLQANNGAVSATSSIGVLYGGTGLTSSPAYGQLLLGNASGGYALTATSSLGLTSSQWTTSGNNIFYNTGNVGIGTSTPSNKLDVWGNFQVGTSAAPVLYANSGGGYVGINVANPGSGLALDVNGTLGTNGIFNYTGGIVNYAGTITNSCNGCASIINNGSAIANSGMIVAGGSTNDGYLSLSSASNGFGGSGDYINFLVGSGEAARVISNGNVGIGTTSPFSRLSVGGNAYIGGNLTATGTLTVGSLNGPLQANNGVVSATSSVGVLYGGTGLTSSPAYGQLLLGNASGGYTLSATSSLGFASASQIGAGTTGQFPYYAANGTTLTATSSLFISANGSIGMGTTSPTFGLSVAQGGYFGTWRQAIIGDNSIPVGTSDFCSGIFKQSLAFNEWTTGIGCGDKAFISQVGDGSGYYIDIANIDSARAARFKANGATVDMGSPDGALAVSGTGAVMFNSGNVGIGTTSPYAALSVVGGSGIVAGKIFATSTSQTSSIMGFTTLGTTVSGGYRLTVDSTSGTNGSAFFNGPNQDTYINDDDSSGYSFYTTNGAQSIGLLNSIGAGSSFVGSDTTFIGGKVGIGTSTPYAALSVVGQAVASYFTATTTTASIFPYASTTALTVSGTNGLNLGSLNGPLQANNGAVSATSSVGVLYGGTGLTSAPSYGQVLLGNGSGGYTLTATSSLGITSGGGSGIVGSGTLGQFPYYAAGGTTLTATSSLFIGLNGNIGIGTTSPYAKLSVAGETVASFFTATTTSATSTFLGGLVIGSNAFNVLQNGNVGIGSSSPATKLSVSGNALISGTSTVGGIVASLYSDNRRGVALNELYESRTYGRFSQWNPLVSTSSQHVPTNYYLATSTTNLSAAITQGNSGATYNPNRNTMMFVNNNDLEIYEFTLEGTLLRSIDLAAGGFLDTEALVWMYGNTFAIAEETGRGGIAIIDIDNSTTSLSRNMATTIDVSSITGTTNNGFEGLAYDSDRDIFYVTKERSPVGVWSVTRSGATSVLFDAVTVWDGINIGDISDVYYDRNTQHLFFAVDECEGQANGASGCDGVIETDLTGVVFDKIYAPVGFGQVEGVGFTPDGDSMFIAGEPDIYAWYRYQGRGGLLTQFAQSSSTPWSLGIGTTSPFSMLSVAGSAFFSGNATASNVIATGTLAVLGVGTSTFANGLQAGLLQISSTTASSTFANGINITGGCFAINGTCMTAGGGGSGTVSAGTVGQIPYYAANGNTLTGTSSLTVGTNGYIGIGTSTPYAALSVVGQVVASYFTATSTTASSTFANGINLTAGCFAVNGTCITAGGGGGGTVGAATAIGQIPYYAAASNVLTATSTLTIGTNSWVGIGTSTPVATFAVSGNTYVSGTTTASTTRSLFYTDSFGTTSRRVVGLNDLYETRSYGKFRFSNGQVATTTPHAPTTYYLATSTFNISAGITSNNSGATYYPGNDTVLVVNNSNIIYEFTKEGTLIRTITLAGFSDTEALTWMYDDWFAIGDENAVASVGSRLTIIQIPMGSTTINKALGTTYDLSATIPVDNQGIEGVAYDSDRDVFYVAEENLGTSPRIIKVTRDGTASVLWAPSAAIIQTLLNIGDFSDVYYDRNSQHLFIAVDQCYNQGNGGVGCDQIIEVTLQGDIVDRIYPPVGFNQIEGIGFSPDGENMFITSEPDMYAWYKYQGTGGALTSRTNNNASTTPWNWGVGTTSPFALFSVHNTSGTSTNTFAVASGTVTQLIVDKFGNFGIGTTSPFTKLSVEGSAYLNGNLTASGTVAALGIGTSTFNGLQASLLNISSTTASSTFANGINITGGCFAINNTCMTAGGGGSGTVSAGTTGQFAYYAANGNTLTATSSLSIGTNGNIGVGTSTPYAKLSVAGQVVGEYFTATSSTASVFPYASTTALSATALCLAADCRTSWPTGGGSLSSWSTTTSSVLGQSVNYSNNNTDIVAIGGNSTTTAKFWFDPTGQSSYLAGNVGFGTQNPLYKFDVTGSSTSSPTVVLRDPMGNISLEIRAGTSTNYSTYIGVDAGLASKDTEGNVAVGAYSLSSNTSAADNTALGYYALNSNTTGEANVAVGASAMQLNTTGSHNVAIGQAALLLNLAATNTVAIGHFAGRGNGDASQNNVFLGYSSGYNNTTGSNNILLGYQSGEALTTGSNNIVIGYDIDAPSVSSSNILNIGNLIYGTGLNGVDTTLSTGNIGIGTTSPFAKLSVVGQVVGQYFTATSSTASTFPYASTTALTVSGTNGLTISSLNGPLQANNGTVSATSSIGVLYGGTGLTSAPTYGQVLVGNASGGYTLTATSSLGITGGGGSGTVGSGTTGQMPYYAANGTTLSATSSLFVGANGNIGIGTSSPYAKLSVVGDVVSSRFFATSTGTSTFAGGLIVGSTAGNLKVGTNSLGIIQLGDGVINKNTGFGFKFNSLIDVASGNSSEPSFGFVDDTDTGMFNPTGNNIAFTMGGSERVRILDTGFTGFGTTTPTGRISVEDSIGLSQPDSVVAQVDPGSSNFTGGDTADYQVYSYKSIEGTTYFSSTGYSVGIQTISSGGDTITLTITPPSSGTVDGYRILRDYNSGGFIDYYDTTSTLLVDDNCSSVCFNPGNTVTPTIFAAYTYLNKFEGTQHYGLKTNGFGYIGGTLGVDGRLGVGTSSPSYKVHIVENDNTHNADIMALMANNLTQGITIGFNTITTTGSNGNNPLALFSQGTGSINLNPTSGGNVGIGTSSPYAKLSVAGQVVGQYFVATSSIASIFPYASTTALSATALCLAADCRTSWPTGGGSGGGSWSTTTSSVAGQLVNYSNNNTDVVAVGGTSTTTAPFWFNPNNLIGYISGKLGIGTSTPYAKLSVAGQVVGEYFSATSSSATSTFAGGVQASLLNVSSTTASSTFANGINLTNGCFAVNGTCVGGSGGSGTVGSGTTGQFAYYAANGTTLSATSSLSIGLNGNIGIGTTSPYAKLSVTGEVVSEFFTATSTSATSTFAGGLRAGSGSNGLTVLQNGNVGIGTLSPVALLDVGGIGASPAGFPNLLAGFKANVDSTATIEIQNSSLGGNASTLLIIEGSGGSNQLSLGQYGGGNVGTSYGLSHFALATIGANNNLAIGSLSGSTLFVTNNTERMRILNSGNIGIGTSTPYSKLTVWGAGTSTNALFSLVNNASSTAFHVLENGFVGFGTSSPVAQVHVYSNTTSGASPAVIIGGNPGGDTDFWMARVNDNDSVDDDSFQIGDGPTPGSNPFMTIDTTGKVGIGTTSPYAALAVVGEIVGRNLTATSTTATSTFAGGLSVNNGAINHDFVTGVTSIDNLSLGALSFDTNAGVVSWMDMPVTSASAINTVHSYSAQIDGNQLLTVYAESNGAGAIQNGRVGFGTTTPWKTFSASGTAAFFGLTVAGSSQSALCITAGGELQVNNAAQTCTVSSARFKHNIKNLESGLDEVMKLRPVSYIYNDTTEERVGFIAEEVVEVDQRFIFTENDGTTPRGVRYEEITSLLVKAIQEQQTQIDDLKAQIASSTAGVMTQGTFDTMMASAFAAVKNWVLDTITAKEIEVDHGITVKDKTTGQYYCIVVDEGDMRNLPGKCAEIVFEEEPTIITPPPVDDTSTTTPPISSTSTPPTSTSTPPIGDDDTSTTTDETSGDDSGTGSGGDDVGSDEETEETNDEEDVPEEPVVEEEEEASTENTSTSDDDDTESDDTDTDNSVSDSSSDSESDSASDTSGDSEGSN